MNKKISSKTKRRLLILLFFVLLLASYIGYTLYGYCNKINDNYNQKEDLTSQLNDLLEREDVLKEEIVKLSDPEYVAKFAREKYLYSKDGEIIFRIIK